MPVIFWLVPLSSLLALGFAYYFFKQLMSHDEGTDMMKRIASHVRKGAGAYLRQQYKIVIIVFAVITVIFAILAYGLNVQNHWVPFAFLTGGAFSGLAGFFGMKSATYASAPPDGRHLRTIPVPAGQGPQEATNLGGIAVAPDGTLFIGATRKVIVYAPDGRFVRSFPVDFMISTVGCPGTEEIVAIGPHGGKILHVFDRTGKLLASFGDTFTPPADLEPMKDMPMFGAPLIFNCAKDGRIFVLNPHKYEVSVFKDRRLETVLAGKSERFKPIQKMGRAFMSTAAHIVQSGGLVFVSLRDPDPKAPKTADIFEAGQMIGSIGLPGTPHVADLQGRIYLAEEEDFPRVVRYIIVKQ